MKVAINGFGRIGRTALRLLQNEKDIEVVAINDLTDASQLAYLFKYDSAHRTYKGKVGFEGNDLIVKGKKIKVLSLFFIDKVANYRQYDSEGNPIKGPYALMFEEEYFLLYN